MPMPSVDPKPPFFESRLLVPDEAHDASYLAASARIASFSWELSWDILFLLRSVERQVYSEILYYGQTSHCSDSSCGARIGTRRNRRTLSQIRAGIQKLLKRFAVPNQAQEASHFAASARTARRVIRSQAFICFCAVPCLPMSSIF